MRVTKILVSNQTSGDLAGGFPGRRAEELRKERHQGEFRAFQDV
jgi:hypothetical protein